MKTLTKGIFSATAATALAVATASPAQAQYRDDGGIDGGDILTGVLIAGAAAAVIAAATSGDDDRYDDRYYGRDYGDRYGRYGQRGYRMNARQAVQQCAAAAQQRASRYGRARVTEITDVDRERDGFEIEGRLVVNEGRYGWNNGYRYNSRYDRYGRYDRDRGSFSCDVRYGRITSLDIDGI